MGGAEKVFTAPFVPPKPPKPPKIDPEDEERRRAALAREDNAKVAGRGRRSLIATGPRGETAGAGPGVRKTLLGE